MTVLAREPKTGFHVFHVIPDAWGPFVDIRAMYQSFARRNPWTSVISTEEYLRLQKGLQQEALGDPWWDPRVAFVVWDLAAEPPDLKSTRKALVLVVYSEALDQVDEKFWPAHLKVWSDFWHAAHQYDGVFGHTPRMSDLLHHLVGTKCKPFVLPVGWDAHAMGAPRWDAPKFKELTFHGSVVGRREIVLPYLYDTFNRGRDAGPLLVNISGAYGRALLGELDTARASLYIAHSDVESYSTWRLWQTASTSCVMLSEPGDTWPFEAERHYIGIERFELGNVWNVSLQIKELLSRHEHNLSVARRAHEEIACKFTLDHVAENYLLPALAELADSRDK